MRACPANSSRQRQLYLHGRSKKNWTLERTIDGQGVALWDVLVQDELDSDVPETVSDIALDSAGYYLVYPPGGAVLLFRPARS